MAAAGYESADSILVTLAQYKKKGLCDVLVGAQVFLDDDEQGANVILHGAISRAEFERLKTGPRKVKKGGPDNWVVRYRDLPIWVPAMLRGGVLDFNDDEAAA